MNSAPRSPRPTYSWSESQARRFQECRRKHYLAVHLAYRGWEADAPADRRLAWLLSRALVGWPAALGVTVHARAMECVRACAGGRPLPGFAQLRRSAGRDLNRVYTATRDHLADFHRAPGRWPVLERRLYGESWCSREELARTRRALDASLETLLTADDLWEVVRDAGPRGVWVPSRWTSFTVATGIGAVDGSARLRVFAQADVVVRRHPGAPAEIWDFKTGGTVDGVVDQVLTYALAARDAMAIPAADGPSDVRYLGRVVHLSAAGAAAGPEARLPFSITDGDLAAAVARIRASAAAMQAPLLDIAARGADIRDSRGTDIQDAYPRTDQRWRCRCCVFRGICEPEAHPLVAVRRAGRGRGDRAGAERTPEPT